MNITIVWDIAPYSPYMNRRLGGEHHLGIILPSRLVALWFLDPLIFYLEDGGDSFLRNAGSHTDFPTYKSFSFQC
jgi:hypothetical protein